MADFQLRRLRPFHRAQAGGVDLLAQFDMDLGPVRLMGCALLKLPDGSVTARPPRLGRGRGEGVAFSDNRVAERVLKAALTAYAAAGYEVPAL